MASFKRKLPYHYFDEFGLPRHAENLCSVVGFDPGETTGWCVMSIEPAALLDVLKDDEGVIPLQDKLVSIDYGQIDCGSHDYDKAINMLHKTASLNLAGENAGISEMLAITMYQWPKSVVVLEDFIPDPNKMDQARHTLSPVRILAGFSFGMSMDNQSGRLSDERIFIQNRSLAKTTCTDARLRRWGLYDERGGRHSRDAIRHAFYFLRTCRGKDEKAALTRHLAWPHLFSDPADTIYDPKSHARKPRERKLGEII